MKRIWQLCCLLIGLTIYKESAEKFERIKKAAHGNSDKMTKSSNPLRAATIKKIQGVLTPTQAVKFDVMIKQVKKGGANDWGEGWS
jgi:protein CpxP